MLIAGNFLAEDICLKACFALAVALSSLCWVHLLFPTVRLPTQFFVIASVCFNGWIIASHFPNIDMKAVAGMVVFGLVTLSIRFYVGSRDTTQNDRRGWLHGARCAMVGASLIGASYLVPDSTWLQQNYISLIIVYMLTDTLIFRERARDV